jgi:MinD-like ATPase involved in chromosome partitioning or flagellar assembly
MLVSCWSAKGGSGTTTVAAALAAGLAARSSDGALLVDLDGDLPMALGCADADHQGVADWLAAGWHVPADALGRLEVPIGSGTRLLPRGHGALTDPARAEVLAEVLAGDGRPVVVDVGLLGAAGVADEAAEVRRVMAGAATISLLVTRPCVLALRRALALPMRPSGIVLTTEPGRSLGAQEVEAVLDAPVLAEVPLEAAIARAVDAGSLATRVPTSLRRALRHAA